MRSRLWTYRGWRAPREVDSGLASTQAEPTRITCIAPCQRPTRFLAGDRSCQVAEWDWPTRTRLRSVRLRFMDPIRRFGLVDISTGLAEAPTCGSPTKLCYHPPTDTVTVGFSRGPVQLLFWDSDAPAADAACPPRALLHTLGSDLYTMSRRVVSLQHDGHKLFLLTASGSLRMHALVGWPAPAGHSNDHPSSYRETAMRVKAEDRTAHMRLEPG